MDASTAGLTPTTRGGPQVPLTLDGSGPARRFSRAAMDRRLRVLFIVSQPNRSPAISVHATLWRFFDPERVEVHVLYNRRAADEPYRSSGLSVLDVLGRAPHVQVVPAEFGPVEGYGTGPAPDADGDLSSGRGP